MHKKLKFQVTFLAIFTLALTACGGGGGGGNNSQPKPDTQINGSVVKGIVKNAVVDIYAIVDGVVSNEAIESVATDINGNYSFTLAPDYSGPVLVVMHDNASNTATMICDNTSGCADGANFGDDIPLGDVQLKTYVQNVVGGSDQTASVTPFTTMAAAYAEELAKTSGSLNAQAIGTANSQVGNLLGINNIVITTPPNIASANSANADRNALRYAYLSAAITSIAQQDHAGDINAAINSLVSTFTSHSGQLISVESANDSSVMSLADLANAALMIAQSLGYNNSVTNDLNDLLLISQAQAVDTPTNAMPSPTSGLGELETVKAFVTDVRTWGNIIEAEINNADTTEIEQRVDMAQATIDISGPLLEIAFEYGFDAAVEAYINDATVDLATLVENDPDVSSASGTATISGSNVVVAGQVNNIEVDMNIDFPASQNASQFVFRLNSANVQDNNAKLSVTSAASVTLNYPADTDLSEWINNPQTIAPFPEPDNGMVDFPAVTVVERNKPNPIDFTGSVSFEVVGSKGDGPSVLRDLNNDVVQYNPKSISFSGSVGNSTNRMTASFGMTMPNADTFLPIDGFHAGYVHLGLGNYSFSNNGNTLIVSIPGQVRTFVYDEVSNTVQINIAYTAGFESNLVAPGTYATFDDYLASGHNYITSTISYVWVDGEGYFDIELPTVWNKTGGSLDGVLVIADQNQPDENQNNFRQITDLNLAFSAELEGLPAADFSINVNRTGFESGDSTISIAYGARRIEIMGAVDQDAVSSASIDVTNQDSVKLSIVLNTDDTNNTESSIVGSIVYDQTQYATIEDINGVLIIRYIDGYFESL